MTSRELLGAATALGEQWRARSFVADTTARTPDENIDALRESGLLALLVPVQSGGLGGDLRDLVRVGIELGGGCASSAFLYAMHCQQVDTIVRYGSKSLTERLLPRVARSDLLIASVTTDEVSGRLTEPYSAAISAGHRTRIDRQSPIVSGARVADGFLVSLRSSNDSPVGRSSLLYVDRTDAQIEFRGSWDTMGMRATESVAMRLCAEVENDCIVGEPGRFDEIAVEAFGPLAHIGWAAVWLGAAREAMRTLVRSAWTKHRAKSTSDLYRARLGHARAELEIVRALLIAVTDEIQFARSRNLSLRRPEIQIRVNALKTVSSERLFSCVDCLIDLAGLDDGYRRNETSLERHFRDLRSARLNYSNDRLLVSLGALTMLDKRVSLEWSVPVDTAW